MEGRSLWRLGAGGPKPRTPTWQGCELWKLPGVSLFPSMEGGERRQSPVPATHSGGAACHPPAAAVTRRLPRVPDTPRRAGPGPRPHRARGSRPLSRGRERGFCVGQRDGMSRHEGLAACPPSPVKFRLTLTMAGGLSRADRVASQLVSRPSLPLARSQRLTVHISISNANSAGGHSEAGGFVAEKTRKRHAETWLGRAHRSAGTRFVFPSGRVGATQTWK